MAQSVDGDTVNEQRTTTPVRESRDQTQESLRRIPHLLALFAHLMHGSRPPVPFSFSSHLPVPGRESVSASVCLQLASVCSACLHRARAGGRKTDTRLAGVGRWLARDDESQSLTFALPGHIDKKLGDSLFFLAFPAALRSLPTSQPYLKITVL